MKKLLCSIVIGSIITQSAYAMGNMRILNEYGKDFTNTMPKEISLQSSATVYNEKSPQCFVIVRFYENSDKFIMQIPYLESYTQISDGIYSLEFSDIETAKTVTEYLNSDPNVVYAQQDMELPPIADDEYSYENEEENSDVYESEQTDGDMSVMAQNSIDAQSDGIVLSADAPNDYNSYQGEYFLEKIHAKAAWDYLDTLGASKSNKAVVAVIDSGVDSDNRDLVNRFYKTSYGNVIGTNIYAGNSDFNDDTEYATTQYHGTAVAGIISAEANNNLGICGVSGPFDVKIMPVKVANSSGGGITIKNLISAIQYAIDNKADVINLSLTAYFKLEGVQDVINKAFDSGITVVCAAGNYHSNQSLYPASYDNVICVSSTDKTDKKSSFSQFNEFVDVCAPGSEIASTYPNTSCAYQPRNGTSFSAPIVSAAAALLKIANPYLSPDKIENIIKESATDLGKKGFDSEFGFGMVNLESALKMAYTGPVTVDNVSCTPVLSVVMGRHDQIKTTIIPENATNKILRFISSDTSIATVSSNGVVYGIKPGEVTVDISSNYNNNIKCSCTIQVLPSEFNFSSMPIDINPGGNPQKTPLPDAKEIIISSDKGGTSVDPTTKVPTTYPASIARMYINDKGSTGIQKKYTDGVYSFSEYLFANAKSTVDFQKKYSYVFLTDKDSQGIIYAAPSTFFADTSPQLIKISLPNWANDEKFISFASDGANFSALTNKKRIAHFNATDSTQEKNKITMITQSNDFTEMQYADNPDLYMYVAIGTDTENNPCVFLSNYADRTWAKATFQGYHKFKSFTINNKTLYLLTDYEIYYANLNRNTSGNPSITSLVKLCDITKENVSKISCLTNGEKKIAVVYGSDNVIYAVGKDGVLKKIYTKDACQKITNVFNYNGDYYIVADGNIYRSKGNEAQNYSLDSSLRLYPIDIIDSDNNMITKVPLDGKVTIEYQIESVAPIKFNSANTSLVPDNKYPAQVVTAIYNANTNALVAIKRKDFIIDFYNNGTNLLGSIFKWEETFNLDPKYNYKIKTFTFKGNGFHWLENGKETNTLNVFARVIEK